MLASGSQIINGASFSPDSIFVVNSDNDSDDVNPGDGVCQDSTGNCTLRAAVQEANATTGTDEITFGLPLPAVIQLSAGEIAVSEALTINASGARAVTIRGNSNTTNGVFNINSTVTTTANINGLTIADSSGRGLTNNGRLSLSDVVIKGNGTGVYNTARLTLNRVLVNNNTSGGIYLTSTSTLVNISNTTITGNTSSDFGGGIYSASADVTLNNVTISSNTAATSGGGFYYTNSAAGINVRNTIIADNTATNGPDVFNTNIATGTFTSRGNNLIGKNFVGSGFLNATNNDQVGTIATPVNPQLGSLQNNGGQTDTRALLTGSPARNAGNTCVASANCPNSNPPTALIYEQRGTDFPRFYESAVDIGAFESFYPTPAISSLSPNSRGSGTDAFELTVNGSNFVADSTVKFNGQSRTTTLVSNTQLKAQILASDTTTAGQYSVIVTNPTPGGGESEAVNLNVTSCSYSINPTSQPFTAAGGTINVAVSTTAGCAWTASVTTSDASWISISSGASGTGSGAVVVNVAANTGPQRNGTVTIAGKTFTVTQSNGCSYSISPTSQNFAAAAAGNNTVAVTTSNAGCQWTAASNAAWITINSGTNGTGNGAVAYSVAANSGSPRNGTLTIAGLTFTVNQSNGCSYTLAPTSQPAAAAAGGTFNVAVTASDSQCQWAAAANSSWITITSGANGTGSGTVTYTVAANNGPQRTGTLTIAGQTFTVTQDGGCTYQISPTSANALAAGDTGTVAVTASNSGCQWTAASNAAWITVTNGATGTGSGTVTYTIAANNGPARSGTLTIAGQTFTVNQASGCAFTLSPTEKFFTSQGGSSTFTVTTPNSGCQWTAVSNATWITVTNGASGTGNGTVTYSVAANGGLQRDGTITINGQTFTVHQENGCSFTLAPPNQNFTAAGGTNTIAVTASNSQCQWTAALASASNTWITITSGASGTGNGTVTYTVAANTGPQRTATLIVGNQTFTVTQDNGCTYQISPTEKNFTSAGGTNTIAVTTSNAQCPWSAAVGANTPWITINGASSGTGNGSIQYTVAASNGAPRSGIINIAGKTFTVTQDDGCVFSINPTSQPFTAAGGSVSVAVSTAAGCAWTAAVTQSDASWISITSGASGAGSGTVVINVTANTGPTRTGTVTIAGKTFTVTQDSGCTFNLNPTSQNVAAAGGNNTVAVTASNAGCQWTAVSNVTWITVTAGASVTGNGTVAYTVAANTGPQRTGTITIGNKTFTVTQDSGCTFSINPTTQPFTAAGGSNTVAVTASNAGCQWTATSNASWITITSGASGTGNGTVAYTVAANTGPQRNGTITIGNQTLTVNQASGCTFTISPTSMTIRAGGDTGTVAVTASNSQCQWTAVVTAANNSWITITSGASGTGNGTVTYSVAANNGAERTGTITIATQTFTITQLSLQVTNLNDSGAGSLRQAVIAANATPGNDVITIQPTLTGTITLTSGEIVVNDTGGALEIRGPGADKLKVSGNNASRIFYSNNAIFTISGLTLTKGNAVGAVSEETNKYGGAILVNQGTLKLIGVHVTDNTITVPAELGSRSLGGGVYIYDGTGHLIENSTFSGNSSMFAGGLYSQGGLTIRNSTFSGNVTQGNGAGILSQGVTSLRNVTITNNKITGSTPGGAGLSIESGSLNLTNTIIAGNIGLEIGFLSGEVSSGGNNLIGDAPGDSTNTQNTLPYQPTDILDTPPLFGTLAAYGGPTPTEVLLPNSPAINHGNNENAPTTDQRGAARIVGGTIDIGAYEFAITMTPAATALPNGRVGNIYTTEVKASRADGSIPNESFTYSIAGGALPTGVILDSGIIYGPPQSGGPHTFVVRATDADGMSGANKYTINVICAYQVSPTSNTVTAGVNTGTVNVLTATGCPWTAVSNAPWITVTGGSSGSGNGSFQYSAAVNPGPQRSNTITVGNAASPADSANFSLTQSSGCSFTIGAPGQTFLGTGGTGTVAVTASNPQCGWSAMTTASWIHITSSLPIIGSGNLNFSVDANTGNPRFDLIDIAGEKFTVNQNSGCPYSISPPNATLPATAGTGSFAVTTNGGCPWTAATTDSWITITSGGGNTNSGNGTVAFSVSANPGSTRTGTITAAGQPFTITQNSSCSYSVSAANINMPTAAGTGNFTVTTSGGCSWNATTSSSWITITSGGGPNSGSGTVAFSLIANAGNERTGTITAAGLQVSVKQAGATSRRTAFDFDGDGKADISVFRPSNNIWYMSNSQAGFSGINFGGAGDKLVPADYDGDGKTDVAVFRPSTGFWYIQGSSAGFYGMRFGEMNDVPAPADFDGDGRADVAVFRPSIGTWFIQRSQQGFLGIQYGIAEDKPLPADYDGDGRADLAVFRPSNRIWYINRTQLGFYGIQFGAQGDQLMPADYDGDGKTDVAIYRPSTGFWYIQGSSTGFYGFAFGISTDLPAAADYDGDGKTDAAVYRAGTWYLNRSTQGFLGIQYGIAEDKPVPNLYALTIN